MLVCACKASTARCWCLYWIPDFWCQNGLDGHGTNLRLEVYVDRLTLFAAKFGIFVPKAFVCCTRLADQPGSWRCIVFDSAQLNAPHFVAHNLNWLAFAWKKMAKTHPKTDCAQTGVSQVYIIWCNCMQHG